MFRFVPSLGSDIEITSLRLALFNYICAAQAGDTLLIRIEEPDQEDYLKELLEMLALFGISYSDILYQSHNLKFHQQLATKLLMDKNAFSCFCGQEPCTGACKNLSDEEVLNNENPFCLRIKASKNAMDDFIILDVNKIPTKTFATALDDLLSDISIVICDEKERTKIPKQILIRDYLGYDKEVAYTYLPPIIGENIPSIKALLEEGILPMAILNYLIMISMQTPTDIFDVDETLTWFSLEKITDTPVAFDKNRLLEINVAHIKRLPALELAKFIGYSSKDLGELAKIYTQEGSTINEIKPKIDAIFAKKEPLVFHEEYAILCKVAKTAPFFKNYEDFESYLSKESGLSDERFFKPLRFLLTGLDEGPELPAIYPHIRNYLGEIIS